MTESVRHPCNANIWGSSFAWRTNLLTQTNTSTKKKKSFLPWFSLNDRYFCPPSLQTSRVFSVVNFSARCLGPPAPLWSLLYDVFKSHNNVSGTYFKMCNQCYIIQKIWMKFPLKLCKYRSESDKSSAHLFADFFDGK